jgi:molecular chaperone DnaK
MKLGESMYKAQQGEQAADATAQAGAAGAQHGGSSGAKPDEKVVDAEFEEVDEKKKKSA